MRTRRQSPEVLAAEERTVWAGKADIDELKAELARSCRPRLRLCAHTGEKDAVHEMFILLTKDAYVRPHKHLSKTESFHILEGRVDVVFFDGSGAVSEVIRMGDYASGLKFYYRMTEPVFHTLILRSDLLVFQETAGGPYNKEDTVFPDWAPARNDSDEGRAYMRELAGKIGASS